MHDLLSLSVYQSPTLFDPFKIYIKIRYDEEEFTVRKYLVVME